VVCEASGKHRHPSVYWAHVAAREMHRTVNRNGELAVDTYVYRCASCRGWHLTRRAVWAGEPQQLLLRAAPVELQLWAIQGPRGPQSAAEGLEDDHG
jgi:hypothetical protein